MDTVVEVLMAVRAVPNSAFLPFGLGDFIPLCQLGLPIFGGLGTWFFNHSGCSSSVF